MERLVFSAGRDGLQEFAWQAVTTWKKRCADKPLCV
jgi:hypothetical protein